MTIIDGMRPIHAGEVLREEFLEPMGLSVNALAIALCVPATRIHAIVHEKRGITADTALRLARYFGTSVELWLNLQNSYDIKITAEKEKVALSRIIPRVVSLENAEVHT